MKTTYFLFCDEETSYLWDNPEEGKTQIETLLENDCANFKIYKYDEDYDSPTVLLYEYTGWDHYFTLTKDEYNQLAA